MDAIVVTLVTRFIPIFEAPGAVAIAGLLTILFLLVSISSAAAIIEILFKIINKRQLLDHAIICNYWAFRV